jgi:hypothetical protein
MTRAAHVLGPAAVVLFAVITLAQTRPDFSGRWTSEPDPSSQPAGGGRGGVRNGDMGSGWGSNIAIAQDAGRLTVEYLFFAPGDMQPPLKFVYALDGSETKNSVMMGRGLQVQRSKAAWDGDKLVITTLHTFEHPETGQPMTSEVKQTLWLESPASLIIETTRGGVLGGPPSTTRTAYRKR